MSESGTPADNELRSDLSIGEKEGEITIKVTEDVADRLQEAKLRDPPKLFTKNMLLLYCYCIVGFSCSSLYGFDASLMSTLLVMEPFQKSFGADVDGIKAGYIVSLLQIGSVCAIPFIGVTLDKLGRRLGMFIGCFVVVFGVLLEGTAAIHNNLSQFLGGRFFIGFGTALAFAAAASYVVEIAHPAYRGVLSGMLNCTYDIGGIVASGVTRGSSKYTTSRAWVIPIYMQLLFSGLVVVSSLFVPESPRWMYAHGKEEKAKEFLIKYHGNQDPDNAFVQLQLLEFSESLEVHDMRWWDFRELVRTRADRIRLMNCLTFAVYSAWSGGGMGNYIGEFYISAGITNETSILNYTLGYNIYSAAFAYLGASVCNKVNRRTLMMIGLVGMFICWVGTTVGTALFAANGSAASAKAGIAFYFLFATSYGISLTPLCGLYPYEVLSYRQRAKGASMYSLVNSAAALVNQFGTPVSLERIGWKTYLIFTCWMTVEIFWGYFTVVETRGFTLEELDEIYASKNPIRMSLKKTQPVENGSEEVEQK